MRDQKTIPSTGSWVGLGKELKKRTLDPIFHASFVIYFFVSVVVVGGAGIWLELCTYLFSSPAIATAPPSLAALRTACITFFPALAGSACMQLIWAEDHQRSLRAFATLVLVVTSILALIIALIPAIQHKTALWMALASSFVALWIWWVANAKQKDLLDPDAPTGGDPSAPLAGDLQGFTTN